MNKKKILILTQAAPADSGRGSRMRIGLSVEALAELGEVSLLVLSQRALVLTEGIPEKYQRICGGRLWQIKDTDTEPTSTIWDMFRPSPKLLASWKHDWVDAPELRNLPSEFDVVWVFRLRMWPVLQQLKLRGLKASKEILDMDDVESVAAFRHAMLMKGRLGRLGFLSALLQSLKLWITERQVTRRFDCVLVCSDIGKKEMSVAGNGSKVKILPNGIHRPAKRNDATGDVSQTGGTQTILFVGSLDFYPNIDGLIWMSDEVLPLLKEALSSPFRVVVVGRNPDPRLRELADKQAFELHADVPDVVAYYEHATVVVAPIWAGSGTRIKILEAFSFGLPVVSTSLGAEGLGTVDGQHLLIADTPSSFAQKIVSLLGDEALRHRLAREADELLERDFTPDAIRQRVGQILEGDTSRRPG